MGALTYGASGAVTALSIIGLYMLFNGEGEAFNVGNFIESISPYAWADTGIALCIGLSVVGAAWSVTHLQSNIREERETEEYGLGASSSLEHPSSVAVSRHLGYEPRT